MPVLIRVMAVLPAALLSVTNLAAQSAAAEPGPRSVAIFDVALFTAGANQQEASDTGRAPLATQVLRATLQKLLGPAVIDSAATDSLARSPNYRPLTGDQPCNVIVACTKAVGRDLGATWVVMAKVSKTSNLIWLLSSQLDPRSHRRDRAGRLDRAQGRSGADDSRRSPDLRGAGRSDDQGAGPPDYSASRVTNSRTPTPSAAAMIKVARTAATRRVSRRSWAARATIGRWISPLAIDASKAPMAATFRARVPAAERLLAAATALALETSRRSR